MGLTVFQALDRAIEAGGRLLASRAVVGTGQTAASLLGEMCAAGLLDKTEGRSPRFTVTARGREAWAREAPERRRREVERREQEQRRQALGELLSLVERKQGKALTKAELSRIPAFILEEARKRGMVRAGEKANTYSLLPAGEEALLAVQPVERQVERLRHLHREVMAAWRAAQGRVAQEVEGAGAPALQDAVGQLAQRGEEALRAFDAALDELGGLARLADAVRQVRAEVEAAIAAEKARLAEAETKLRQESASLRERLESWDRQAQACLAELARKQEQAAVPEPRPAPQRNGPPPPAVVWEAVRTAHERLKQENSRVGGIVKVPELTDAVMKLVDGLTPGQLHEMLKSYQAEDRLTLQLCNDPRLEPRAAEGIHSSRGLLFYVQMR